MGEFMEVAKQRNRMCRETPSCDDCALKHVKCKLDRRMTDEDISQLEELTMTWAAANPEMRYPTWAEWWEPYAQLPDGAEISTMIVKVPVQGATIFVCDDHISASTDPVRSCWERYRLSDPIPAKIAVLMGVGMVEGRPPQKAPQ